MDEETIVKFARDVEVIGFDRGVKSIIEIILSTQKPPYDSITYKSIQMIYDEFVKQSDEQKKTKK